VLPTRPRDKCRRRDNHLVERRDKRSIKANRHHFLFRLARDTLFRSVDHTLRRRRRVFEEASHGPQAILSSTLDFFASSPHRTERIGKLGCPRSAGKTTAGSGQAVGLPDAQQLLLAEKDSNGRIATKDETV
jgi:hypothetical protein